MVTAVGTVTAALVVTGNVAIVAPAATVTEPEAPSPHSGCCSSASPPHRRLARRCRASPCPCCRRRPVTAAGETVTPTSRGFSVSVEFVDAPRHVAVMLACVGTVTALVLTGNVALSRLQPR